MEFIWAIIAGLIIGVIARAIRPGKQAIPMWLTIVIGIVGAIVGNLLASAFGVRDTNGIDWIRHILQIAVAVVLIGIVEPLWSRRSQLGGRTSP
jgi:uncharacterized membrane protein YeaQ/YmgE (transglycosylase-associated protein family)